VRKAEGSQGARGVPLPVFNIRGRESEGGQSRKEKQYQVESAQEKWKWEVQCELQRRTQACAADSTSARSLFTTPRLALSSGGEEIL